MNDAKIATKRSSDTLPRSLALIIYIHWNKNKQCWHCPHVGGRDASQIDYDQKHQRVIHPDCAN